MTVNTAVAAASTAVPDILEEHLEELAFLGIRRRKVRFSPELGMPHVVRLEQRGEAHRDGLRVGTDATRELVERVWDAGGDAWLVYAAASTWLDLVAPDAAALETRCTALPPDQLPSWREALREHGVQRIPHLAELTAPHRSPTVRHLALDALGWHSELTPYQATLAARDAEAVVRWAAARHIGHALPTGAAGLITQLAHDPDAAVRATALWSAALLNRDWALNQARTVEDPVALRILGLLGGDDVVSSIAASAGNAERRPAAIAALVEHGGVAAADALFALVAEDESTADALAAVFGPLPDLAELRGSDLRDRWHALAGDGDVRLRLGQARPWPGPVETEPMEWRWRAAIAGLATVDVAALRRAVPDGLLAGTPREDAVPGE